jgi:hypothetical protein
MAFKQPRKYSDEEFDDELEAKGSMGASLGRLRSGRWDDVESLADEMIRRSLVGVTRYQDKSDVLTSWKLQMRQKREVLTSSGFPDSSIRRGMYRRCANPTRPELNSRDGIARARTRFNNNQEAQYNGHSNHE